MHAGFGLLVALATACVGLGTARAQTGPAPMAPPPLATGTGTPALHAIVAHPTGTDVDAMRRRVDTALRASGLGSAQVVELAVGPPSRAPQHLAAGIAALDKLAFGEAQRELDAAVEAAAGSGAAGLPMASLVDVFLLRALVVQRLEGTSATPLVFEDCVRAATIAPEHVLDPGRFPPAMREIFARASAEIGRRGRGTLVVRAGARARVVVDGRAAVPSPAVIPALPYGEHLVRVEDPGRLPWASVVTLGAPVLEIEAPTAPAIALDDSGAVEAGRRVAAAFVLLAQPWSGADRPLVELRLIEVSTGLRRDGALVALADGDPALDRAVLRLAEEAGAARRAPGAPGPIAAPAAEASMRRWAPWVMGAVAAAVAVSVVAVGLASSTEGAGEGFSVSVDPGGLRR